MAAGMSAEVEKHCTVLIYYDKGVPPNSDELAKRLESKKDAVKAEALEELVLLMINGESYPKLLMTIIKFVVASSCHRVKKLLTIYWEIVEKCKDNGDLKEEMILVCNALRSDLMHANEYIRGSTCRLLCKMKYYRILEPLKEAVLRNLSHRHSYVRRNAVMCVYSIVKSFGLEVMPEAPEDIEQLLLVEGDLSTKRNAFLMLLNCDQERAVKYVLSMQDQVGTMGDIFQLSVLELVRKVCRGSPANKGRLLRIVFDLASSSSTAVSYDCASTLVSLSSSPLAVKQATSAYVALLTEQSDNNVKLIVLDRLQEVQKHHKMIMESMVMDIFRALSCPSFDVRKKVMDICLSSLVSPRNIKDVVNLLKKEVTKTIHHDSQGVEGNMEYRRLLIRALHSCTAQYGEQAQSIMYMVMEFLTDSDQTVAAEVIMFLRELIANYPHLRVPIMQRLADTLADVTQSRVSRGILWLFGEYCEEQDLIQQVMEAILEALRPLPLIVDDAKEVKDAYRFGNHKLPLKHTKEAMAAAAAGKKDAPAPAGKVTTRTIVLPDGTYGTENVYEKAEVEEVIESKGSVKNSKLRSMVALGDFLLSAMIGVSLTKLLLKVEKPSEALKNEVLLVTVNILKIVKQYHSGQGGISDCSVRLTQCIRILVGNNVNTMTESQLAASELIKAEWGSTQGKTQLAKVLELATQNSEWAPGQQVEVEERTVAPDECIVFRQLRERKGQSGGASIDDDDDFITARGSLATQAAAEGILFAERLAKVQQMTGLADPVYVEAFLQVHGFDIVLELLMINRTQDVLQNVVVELSTHGDLKIVDRPAAVTLGAGQQMMVHASIKVASTEAGIIFGYVTYEKKSAADKECTVLNELHVDILDYIERATIGELSFRTMWSEFEWENKININTTITQSGDFLVHIMRNTNFSIVGYSYKKPNAAKGEKKTKVTNEDIKEMMGQATSIKKLIDTSSFVAVNLYAKSIFGEDAVCNISIEQLKDGKLTGQIRVRSRTQGIALSLGDRIKLVQRAMQGTVCRWD